MGIQWVSICSDRDAHGARRQKTDTIALSKNCSQVICSWFELLGLHSTLTTARLGLLPPHRNWEEASEKTAIRGSIGARMGLPEADMQSCR